MVSPSDFSPGDQQVGGSIKVWTQYYVNCCFLDKTLSLSTPGV